MSRLLCLLSLSQNRLLSSALLGRSLSRREYCPARRRVRSALPCGLLRRGLHLAEFPLINELPLAVAAGARRLCEVCGAGARERERSVTPRKKRSASARWGSEEGWESGGGARRCLLRRGGGRPSGRGCWAGGPAGGSPRARPRPCRCTAWLRGGGPTGAVTESLAPGSP